MLIHQDMAYPQTVFSSWLNPKITAYIYFVISALHYNLYIGNILFISNHDVLDKL